MAQTRWMRSKKGDWCWKNSLCCIKHCAKKYSAPIPSSLNQFFILYMYHCISLSLSLSLSLSISFYSSLRLRACWSVVLSIHLPVHSSLFPCPSHLFDVLMTANKAQQGGLRVPQVRRQANLLMGTGGVAAKCRPDTRIAPKECQRPEYE